MKATDLDDPSFLECRKRKGREGSRKGDKECNCRFLHCCRQKNDRDLAVWDNVGDIIEELVPSIYSEKDGCINTFKGYEE